LGENVSNPGEYDVVVLGSRVTVVDRNDALAHREDRDVSEALRGLFDDDRTSVNDNLSPNGYRTTVNTRQNGGIVSATSMKIRRLHHE
jgi:pyruvate/2-oxoglutarate dehydrogenase complex dihydrolipoamide dehydrogenase (E3) component